LLALSALVPYEEKRLSAKPADGELLDTTCWGMA
jgi:hypothetical protein